ncbi:MAG: hypothetical protein M1835_007710 [Candelina submexicana]|nr:MAG: hypothetical protein M1835_007710 [Candelina submexicana]
MGKMPVPFALRHGRHIFVYSNLRTNQVIYSLTRDMNNNAALRQLPYLGKKTVPAALRKDLWQPLATISFPDPPQGLTAFRKLREYRKLHELSYPLDDIKDKNGKLLGKKQRGKKLMDQKANSIADIAAVLQSREKGNVVGEAGETAVKDASPRDKLAIVEEEAVETRRRIGAFRDEHQRDKVKISWADILDAEYAETWPESVVHDGMRLEKGRTVAPVPKNSPEEIEAMRQAHLKMYPPKRVKVAQAM